MKSGCLTTSAVAVGDIMILKLFIDVGECGRREDNVLSPDIDGVMVTDRVVLLLLSSSPSQ